MKKPIGTSTLILLIVASVIILGYVGIPMLSRYVQNVPGTPPDVSIPDKGDLETKKGDTTTKGSTDTAVPVLSRSDFKTFDSKDEVVAYIQESQEYYYGGGVMRATDGVMLDNQMIGAPEIAMDAQVGIGGSVNTSVQKTSADRVSDTNVRTQGIDEPDIVKTNGKDLFLASPYRYTWYDGMPEPMPMPIPRMQSSEAVFIDAVDVDSMPSDIVGELPASKIVPPQYYGPLTSAISAFPPEDMELLAQIQGGNELLLAEDNLVVIDYNMLRGYDMSDPSDPQEEWVLSLTDNTQYQTARLSDGTLYLVTQRYLDRWNPCPIRPYVINEVGFEIACSDIYHPNFSAQADVTYTVSQIDAASGEIQEQITFVGSYQSVVYMSQDSIYVAYQKQGDYLELIYGFMFENADLFPKGIIEKVRQLRDYDLSEQAKMMELESVLNDYMMALDKDDRLRFETESQDRMSEYLDKHKRELIQTALVRINADDLIVKAMGAVPGVLLNDFSLDEYNGYLRTAVTVGDGAWRLGFNGSETENDVYVLDQDLDIVGAVKGMGLTERVYSARFIGDTGYIVTFRQTDPFYVIDLSKPNKPVVAGELKIPGYSSYLHPLSDDLIVGIGKEGSKVKISLFDVSDPSNPLEADKYELNEYWSDVLSTHHAFLHDKKHGVFFMPGSRGGYIFTYENNNLSLKKAVGDIQARRALYLDDYMYIIGNDNIVVLDENTWERVAEFMLKPEFRR